MNLINEFLIIAKELNNINITPTLIGSLGLEYITKRKWNPSDIDIHVPGDSRGWDAPDELRIYDFDKIKNIMTKLGYELIDIHEHEFSKNNINVEFGTINSLYDFCGVKEEDLEIKNMDDIHFKVPNLRQYLKIYEASSKDSYRNENNNNKDFKKIDWLIDSID